MKDSSVVADSDARHARLRRVIEAARSQADAVAPDVETGAADAARDTPRSGA